jgi:hypothetical protein
LIESKIIPTYTTFDITETMLDVKHYDFCLDRRNAEKQLLQDFNIHLVDGEWVKYSDALEIINVIRK